MDNGGAKACLIGGAPPWLARSNIGVRIVRRLHPGPLSMMKVALPLLSVALVVSACSPPAGPAPKTGADTAAPPAAGGQPAQNLAPEPAPQATVIRSPEPWLGRWDGPEGLFLEITAGPVPNSLRLRNMDTLDRTADYEGVLVDEGFQFQRDGRTLTVRRGAGADTGFSALRSRTNCLIVRPGEEGYCRPVRPASPAPPPVSLPLTPGVYVDEAQTCADPAFAGLRTFDGRGIGSAHTRACRATIASKSGSAYVIDNSCLDAGSGPADRSSERLNVTIHDRSHFSVRTAAGAGRYRLCPVAELPAALRR
jgi:hypothetical protein